MYQVLVIVNQCEVHKFIPGTWYILLRGTILNRTYGTHKNLHISLLLLTIFGPIYCGPPYY